MRTAGTVGTLLLCVVLGLFEAFTLYVLAKFAERYSASNYSVLVRKALGRKTAASVWPPACCCVNGWLHRAELRRWLCRLVCHHAALPVGLVYCIPGHHRRLVQLHHQPVHW